MKLPVLLLALCISVSSFAQQKFVVKQAVEVQRQGKWYKATIVEQKGDVYRVRYQGKVLNETIPASRIRLLNQDEKGNSAQENSNLRLGKYTCTASRYSGGEYTYIPKGSFELRKDGSYVYNGFSKPSTGLFKVNASGVISFKQGYLNGGEATPMEGYENRYYLVFPTIPDGRWTCRLVE